MKNHPYYVVAVEWIDGSCTHTTIQAPNRRSVKTVYLAAIEPSAHREIKRLTVARGQQEIVNLPDPCRP